MVNVSNIICKGVGITGMSAVLYDAFSVGKHNSKRVALSSEADRFEKIHMDTRTLTNESPINSAIQEKAKTMRMNNPFSSMFASVSGAVSGFLGSLADNLIPTSLASLAIITKGAWAKASAGALAIYGVVNVLRESFGVGKHSPIE